MSVKTHEAFSLDSFQDRLLWFDDFHGDQIQDEWNVIAAGAGTAAVVDAQTGGIVRLATDGDDEDNILLDWQDYRSLLVSKKVSMEFRGKLSEASATNLQFRLSYDGNLYVGFNHFTNAAPLNWSIQAKNGVASLTSNDSGILVDTDYHIYRIECFPTDEVHYYIDGIETANSPITTNIPPSYLQPSFFLQAKNAAVKNFDIDYIYIRQERI